MLSMSPARAIRAASGVLIMTMDSCPHGPSAGVTGPGRKARMAGSRTAVPAQSQDQIAGELVRRRVNSHPVLHDLIKPAAPGAHPKPPRTIFEHGLYVVMAQALPFGKDGERPGGQPDQPFVRADAHVAPAILEKRIDLVVRHAAAIHFGAKTAIDEPIQTTVGSHPKIGLAVLKDCADHIIGQTVGSAVIVKPPRSIPD